MASAINLDLDNIGMEDSDQLDAILEMASARISTFRFTTRYIFPITFRGQTPIMEKLECLRRIVETIAPQFVDMDFPYWDWTWTKFPKNYTVDQISRDAEHGLNVLPQALSTFDESSIDLYRRFLKNVVYWLGKFRYRIADRTYYDKTFRRTWSWNDWSDWGHATENGEDVDKSLGELRSSQVGVIYRDSPRYLSSHTVTISETNNQTKAILLDRRTGPYEKVENTCSYEIRNVPQNLTTANPTAFRVTLLWFIIPDGTMDRNLEPIEVTDREVWATRKWGPNDENTATEYTATDGYSEVRNEEAHRGQFRETWLSHRDKTELHNRRTNWTDDGTRSAVVLDETTPESERYPSTNWNQVETDEFEGFGKVSGLTSAPPCFNAGVIEPHEKITVNVCDQSALPAPSYPRPTPVHIGGGTYCFGIDSIAWAQVYAHTRWIPILDFGDFEIPQPEDEED